MKVLSFQPLFFTIMKINDFELTWDSPNESNNLKNPFKSKLQNNILLLWISISFYVGFDVDQFPSNFNMCLPQERDFVVHGILRLLSNLLSVLCCSYFFKFSIFKSFLNLLKISLFLTHWKICEKMKNQISNSYKTQITDYMFQNSIWKFEKIGQERMTSTKTPLNVKN